MLCVCSGAATAGDTETKKPCWRAQPATSCGDAEKDCVMRVFRDSLSWRETQRCSLAGEHCQRHCADTLMTMLCVCSGTAPARDADMRLALPATLCRNIDKDHVMCVFRNGRSWRPRDATCWRASPVTLYRYINDCVVYVFRNGPSWRHRDATCWRALPATSSC